METTNSFLVNHAQKEKIGISEIIENKVRLDNLRIECQQALETAKQSYRRKLVNKVNDSSTSQKFYWKITKRVMNKSRAPKVAVFFL